MLLPDFTRISLSAVLISLSCAGLLLPSLVQSAQTKAKPNDLAEAKPNFEAKAKPNVPALAPSSLQPNSDTYLKVTLGRGRAQLKVKNFKLLNEQRRFLEWELLASDDLSADVLSPELKSVYITGEDVEILTERQLSITRLVQIIEAKFDEQRPQPKLTQQSMIFGDDAHQVVMGTQFTLPYGQRLSELVVIGGDAEIFGEVEKLVVIGGHAHLRSTALITKELHALGGVVDTDKGARVSGRRTDLAMPLSDKTWELIKAKINASPVGEFLRSWSLRLYLELIKLVVLLGFAAFAYYLTPHYQARIDERLATGGVGNLLAGAVSLLLILPISMLLLLTIVGIPLMPLQFSLVFLFFLFGYISISAWLGRWVMSQLHSRSGHYLIQVVVGLVMIELVGWVPYVGSGLTWLGLLAGFGAASKVFYQGLIVPRYYYVKALAR